MIVTETKFACHASFFPWVKQPMHISPGHLQVQKTHSVFITHNITSKHSEQHNHVINSSSFESIRTYLLNKDLAETAALCDRRNAVCHTHLFALPVFINICHITALCERIQRLHLAARFSSLFVFNCNQNPYVCLCPL